MTNPKDTFFIREGINTRGDVERPIYRLFANVGQQDPLFIFSSSRRRNVALVHRRIGLSLRYMRDPEHRVDQFPLQHVTSGHHQAHKVMAICKRGTLPLASMPTLRDAERMRDRIVQAARWHDEHGWDNPTVQPADEWLAI